MALSFPGLPSDCLTEIFNLTNLATLIQCFLTGNRQLRLKMENIEYRLGFLGKIDPFKIEDIKWVCRRFKIVTLNTLLPIGMNETEFRPDMLSLINPNYCNKLHAYIGYPPPGPSKPINQDWPALTSLHIESYQTSILTGKLPSGSWNRIFPNLQSFSLRSTTGSYEADKCIFENLPSSITCLDCTDFEIEEGRNFNAFPNLTKLTLCIRQDYHQNPLTLPEKLKALHLSTIPTLPKNATFFHSIPNELTSFGMDLYDSSYDEETFFPLLKQQIPWTNLLELEIMATTIPAQLPIEIITNKNSLSKVVIRKRLHTRARGITFIDYIDFVLPPLLISQLPRHLRELKLTCDYSSRFVIEELTPGMLPPALEALELIGVRFQPDSIFDAIPSTLKKFIASGLSFNDTKFKQFVERIGVNCSYEVRRPSSINFTGALLPTKMATMTLLEISSVYNKIFSKYRMTAFFTGEDDERWKHIKFEVSYKGGWLAPADPFTNLLYN